MTWTSAFGRGCGVILQAIVDGLALTRISPNVLTFYGSGDQYRRGRPLRLRQ